MSSSRRKQTRTADTSYSADDAARSDDGSDVDGEQEGEIAVQHAWAELADIEKEQERWSELRGQIEDKLEMCRQRGVALEDVSFFTFLHLF